MSCDPIQHGVEVEERFGLRRLRPFDQNDLKPELARRLDLGVGRLAAAVLGDQNFDRFRPHQLDLIGEREGPAGEDQLVIRKRVDLGRRVDRAHEIAMLRGAPEGGEPEAPLGEKDDAARGAQRLDGFVDRGDLGPSVAGQRLPRQAGKNGQRAACGAAGYKRVRGHAGREGMGRVDNRLDPLGFEVGGEALGATEAADPLRDRRGRRTRRGAGQRERRGDAGLFREPACERACFRRAAENKEAKGLQEIAP